ncbi:unnamed protein product [Calypogeia fissa]
MDRQTNLEVPDPEVQERADGRSPRERGASRSEEAAATKRAGGVNGAPTPERAIFYAYWSGWAALPGSSNIPLEIGRSRLLPSTVKEGSGGRSRSAEIRRSGAPRPGETACIR